MLLDYILSVRYEAWIAAGIIVFIGIIGSLFKSTSRHFPPGPWGLLIVGYIPFLSKDVHLHFINLTKKYGNVFSTLADTNVFVYDMPAGTIVIANFWAVHHDPRHWEDPETFKPERFLAPDGKSVVKSPHYMPFSFGKRACPGETMAYMEIFLYFVSLLQQFHVRFPDGYKPTYEGNLPITYKPPLSKISFISKN